MCDVQQRVNVVEKQSVAGRLNMNTLLYYYYMYVRKKSARLKAQKLKRIISTLR